jgi:hypothetical protein
MPNLVFNRGKFVAAGFPLAATSEVVPVMLVTTGYVANQDHNLVDDGTTDDPKSYEIGVGGYSRQNLANKVRFEDDTNDFAGIDADNVTFTSLVAGATIGAAITYRYSSSGGTTSDTGQELLAYYELTATPTNGGDITIAWASTSAGGVLKYGTTS